MKEAARVFRRNSNHQLPSSVFLSRVARKPYLNPENSSVGPGHYQVALPIIKPLNETIIKNENTIIVRIKRPQPSFLSSMSRFEEASIKDNSIVPPNLSHAETKSLHAVQNQFPQKKQYLKGSQWSRYREVRSQMSNPTHMREGPGPGRYEITAQKLKVEEDQHASWHFRSVSKRQVFHSLETTKVLLPRRQINSLTKEQVMRDHKQFRESQVPMPLHSNLLRYGTILTG